jgi:hypothetical protein
MDLLNVTGIVAFIVLAYILGYSQAKKDVYKAIEDIFQKSIKKY